MSATRTGILIGAVLAISWILFGFWPFIGVAVAMAIGALVGRVVDGKLDLSSVAGALTGRRSSS